MNRLELLSNRLQERKLLETLVIRKAVNSTPLQILEAGCGHRWPLKLEGIEFTLTGVDLDEAALEVRRSALNDLNETIVGDLRSVQLQENHYDVIYSSFVLEHIRQAESVLDNFVRWLKPQGLLILKIPDRNTVWGFFTRMTPSWFHILFKKYILGNSDAGKPGYGPYPTIHETVISRKGMLDYCQKHHLLVKGEYGLTYYLNRRGIATLALRGFVVSISALSWGRLPWRYCDLTFVIEKPQGTAPRTS